MKLGPLDEIDWNAVKHHADAMRAGEDYELARRAATLFEDCACDWFTITPSERTKARLAEHLRTWFGAHGRILTS